MKWIDVSFHKSYGYLSLSEYLEKSTSNIKYSSFLKGRYDIRFIFHTSRNGSIRKNGITFIFRRKKINSKFLFPFKLSIEIKKHKPDVILAHSIVYIHFVAFLRLFVSKKIIILVQNHGELPPKSMFKKKVVQWSDRLVDGYLFAASQMGRPWIENGLIANPDKIFEVMEGSTNFGRQRDQYGERDVEKSKVCPVFLWVGRLNENKDPICVLKALNLLKNSGYDFEFYMFYHTTELLADIQAFIKDQEMEYCVFLKGEIEHEELESWYNRADFYISSSHKEGSGYALCEAMACGCIPIVTKIPSFYYMTKEGYAGLLFDIGDYSGLYQQLQKAYNLDVEIFRKKVLKVFDERLSFTAIAKGLDEVVQTLLTKK